MPKSDDEKKKKRIEQLLEEAKKAAPDATKAEIDELEKLIEEIVDRDNEPWWKRILEGSASFLAHFALMYVVSLLSFGFFFSELAVSNKYLIFLISLVVSFVLVLFEEWPRNPLRKHFISINLMIFGIIVMVCCIVNKQWFMVFKNSLAWFFYMILDEVFYYLFEYGVLKKLMANQ